MASPTTLAVGAVDVDRCRLHESRQAVLYKDSCVRFGFPHHSRCQCCGCRLLQVQIAAGCMRTDRQCPSKTVDEGIGEHLVCK
eukprot:747317-Pelagomonas_calceolata.AAC.3